MTDHRLMQKLPEPVNGETLFKGNISGISGQSSSPVNIIKYGMMEYGEALRLQQELLLKRRNDEINDTLVLLEHPPVITLGIRGNESNILAGIDLLESLNVKIYRTGRGGDVTYHGPGQVVGYIIMNLRKNGTDIRKFVRSVEEIFISLLKNEFNIEAHCKDNKYTGVWIGDEKITAIGISVHHGVTMHGFAFNVNTDLEHFKWITPCGISDKGVTSLRKLTNAEYDIETTKDIVGGYFCRIFGMTPEKTDPGASHEPAQA